MTMSCDEAVTRLWEHLEGRTEAAGPDLDEHLGECRRCCGEAEFAGMLRDVWAQSAVDTLPPAAQDRLEELLSDLETTP